MLASQTVAERKRDARAEVLAVKRVYRLSQTGRLTELREEQGLSQSDLARTHVEHGIARDQLQQQRGPRAVAVLELLEADP